MMVSGKHNRLAAGIPEVLADLLGVDKKGLDIHREDFSGADYVIKALGKSFVVEFKMTASAANISVAVKQVADMGRKVGRSAIPLLVVPFMGSVGRRVCEEANVAWIDLSGNASIIAPGLRIILDGRPNRFRSLGRPSSVFAPKSARVARWLLMHPHEAFGQREIARATDMGEGFVSRIVARLENEGYLDRLSPGESGSASKSNDESGINRANPRSFITLRDPDLLLDAWRDSYIFSKHAVIKGHVATRSGDALLKFASEVLSEQGIEYAATGLAAAWALTSFAAFRLTTIYMPMNPPPEILRQLGFREEPRGANLWLVVPNDAGVFQGASEKEGIRCAHPVQVYLDLKEQPERAGEAAERLRADLLNWRRDA